LAFGESCVTKEKGRAEKPDLYRAVCLFSRAIYEINQREQFDDDDSGKCECRNHYHRPSIHKAGPPFFCPCSHLCNGGANDVQAPNAFWELDIHQHLSVALTYSGWTQVSKLWQLSIIQILQFSLMAAFTDGMQRNMAESQSQFI